jgi:release factor glutamine methyltransferase
MTVREALMTAIPRLATQGIETARLDAELLVARVLGVARTWLAAHPEGSLSAEQDHELEALVRRREGREPLPYLLGEWEFLGTRLRVTPAVLIPRPETETLVEAVAQRLPPGARVLDVGTGSGCIALGLAQLREDVGVVGIDRCAGAVAVARENAQRAGLSARVTFGRVLFPAGPARLPGPFDAVVSNPPYIPQAMIQGLQPEVRDYEPRAALDGGADGLAFHEILLTHSAPLLRPSGLLAVEIMAGQEQSVAGLAERRGGWGEAEIVPDLAGIPRVLIWRRRDGS